MVAAGVLFFLNGISGLNAQRAWQAYLINFLFWSGIAFSAMLFVAILNMTNARWGRPLKRLAEALGAFTLPSYLLFWGLYFGRGTIFPWIREPVHGKESWLNSTFMFARDGIGLFLLTAVSLALIFFSIKKERQTGLTQHAMDPEGLHEGNPILGSKNTKDSSWKSQAILSPILAILYAFVLTLIAFDLIMSLDPHWYSTLFGAYYFVGSFYSGLAALVLLAGFFKETLGKETDLGRILQPRHFHDLGKLFFGFCMMTGYLFYTQFLVIWFGNIPEETHYLIKRLYQMPWKGLALSILFIAFGIPFILLLTRKIKMKPGALIGLGFVVLAGMWLERFLLIVPSLSKSQEIPLGLSEIMITGGFFGAMTLTVLFFLNKFPLLPSSDPLFQEEWKRIQEEIRLVEGP